MNCDYWILAILNKLGVVYPYSAEVHASMSDLLWLTLPHAQVLWLTLPHAQVISLILVGRSPTNCVGLGTTAMSGFVP